MPKGFCTRVHLWGSSYNTFLLTETFLLGQFLLRPVNQLLAPGGSIHQVCGTIKEPIFVEWYHNKVSCAWRVMREVCIDATVIVAFIFLQSLLSANRFGIFLAAWYN